MRPILKFEANLDPSIDIRRSARLSEEINEINENCQRLKDMRMRIFFCDMFANEELRNAAYELDNQILAYRIQIEALEYDKSLIDNRIRNQNCEAVMALYCLDLGYSVFYSNRRVLDRNEIEEYLKLRGEM